MDAAALKEHLLSKGATLVGVGDITDTLTRELVHLGRAVSIAYNRGLDRGAVAALGKLQKAAEKWLKERGFRSFSIPPDSDRISEKMISKLYHLVSHKTGATCSGLGWVGKNGLIINERYGSKLSWATVLTDAPLDLDAPLTESLCGDCELCVKHCPSGAISGNLWSKQDPFKPIVDYEKCRSLKKTRRAFEEKPNCGLCIILCPYSRNWNT